MNKPLISVISIIYQVEPYLRECLSSLCSLTYPSLELILVVGQKEVKGDDGNLALADDGCLKIAEEFAAKDQRIKIVKCKASGVGDARNRGLNAVNGEFIGFVDGDDYVEPDMFDRLFENLERYGADISVCGKYSEYPDGREADRQGTGPEILSSEEAVAMLMAGDGFFFHCWDKLFKAELFKRIRFPEDKYLEDRYVVGNLIADSEKIVYDRTPLYHFRVRTDSVSHYKKMSELNSDADMEFTEYVLKRFPGLEKRAEAFCIYGHITCIQNALTEGYFDPREEEKHFIYVREHKDSARKNPFVNRNTRLKIWMTLHCLPLLKFITERSKKRQGNRQGFTRKDGSLKTT